MFWLTNYLKENNFEYHSGYIPISYEIGNLLGSIALGMLNQNFKYKTVFMPLCMFVCSIMFFLFNFEPYHISIYYILTFIGGFGISGPFVLISTVIVTELGKTK